MPVQALECAATDASSPEGMLGMATCAREGDERMLDVGALDPADLQARLPLLFDHILGEVVHELRSADMWTVASSLQFEVGDPDLSSMDRLIATPVWLSHQGGIVQGRGIDHEGRGLAGGMLRLLYVPEERRGAGVAARSVSVNDGSSMVELIAPRHGRDGSVATLSVDAPEQWANGLGVMHGGIVGASAVLCGAAAAETDLALQPLRSFRADYLRPVAVDRDVALRAQVVRRGRRLTHVQVMVGEVALPDARLHLVFETSPGGPS